MWNKWVREQISMLHLLNQLLNHLLNHLCLWWWPPSAVWPDWFLPSFSREQLFFFTSCHLYLSFFCRLHMSVMLKSWWSVSVTFLTVFIVCVQWTETVCSRFLRFLSFFTLTAGTPMIPPRFSSSGESLSGLHLFQPWVASPPLKLLHLLFLFLVLLQAFPTRHTLNSSWETNEDGCETATAAEGDGGASAHLSHRAATPPSLKIILSWTSGVTEDSGFACLFVGFCGVVCHAALQVGHSPMPTDLDTSADVADSVFLLEQSRKETSRKKVRFHKFVTRNLNRQVQTLQHHCWGN